MERKSFKQRYKEEVRKPTRPQAFIAEVAKVTCRSEATVKLWLKGYTSPDGLTRKVLAEHFGVTEEELFPKEEEAKGGAA